ncbi:MAG: hypothetical protein JGK17_08700 [Microcoleus sp. PH2017_10_PVI_O_A]|uniref:hypothetical protein n=1 Tax=unclassified Microcoleus TaxID=2642155 RepID=UPI001DF74A0D|nr:MULTISPECIES: hypothetical protein [unclassified Microcoleus]MCC3405659.1 hypothetical protein [Microcoleus sp. PH2017_10_PVI_O_A]MCC3459574.1 hypothetical protein [Microcoleus sp. PH2017_11_PCY_U_A]MCC3478124.1 hypothetical protein [Microcoleus sp. PH2017_12_PCY_D_A]MCC3528115.1 hypothetical protein [Microcoleus sp. PH2017_21_RUC_O_A]MCC3540146.1 hypothetical protein [Microcoleus sp. PH2017_22_RUC_O_B]
MGRHRIYASTANWPQSTKAIGLLPVFLVNPAATNLGQTDASAIDQFPLLYHGFYDRVA